MLSVFMRTAIAIPQIMVEIAIVISKKTNVLMKNIAKNLCNTKDVCIFAMRHFCIHIWFWDFLCPAISNCVKYKQRFLRTYSPQSQYGSVATWRNALLSLYMNK